MAGINRAEARAAKMSSRVSRRTTCRLCEAPDVELVLHLQPTPPADAYVPADRLKEPQDSYPLDLFFCRRCGHAQLLDVVDPKVLFQDYLYISSSSPGLEDHFQSYSDQVLAYAKPPAGALALDIGSNNGILLKLFKQQGLKVLGVDPAREIAGQATRSGIETIPAFFSSHLARQLRAERGPAAIVTANNVFAHSDG